MRDTRFWTRLHGFTVLELLVTVAIIGVLVGLLLPALMAAREAARRMQCTSNLHELGIAIQQYHDSAHKLPAAWSVASDGTSGYGWALDLLPYVEEADLQKRIARQAPITAVQNQLVRETELPIMRCPSDIAEPTFELFPEASEHHPASSTSRDSSSELPVDGPLVRLPTANYVGVYGTLEADESFPAPRGDGPIVSDRSVRLEDLTRGQSHTLIVGERTTAMVPSTWLGITFRGEDAACRIVGSAITAPNCEPCDECEFASRHSGGANFVWADGHVSLVSNDVDSLEYQRLAQRQP
jgi:prepilin-type processing-associated H-X9-DG protein/prepilin-type N-terminal cleavage/methylation domain-containing protein